MDEPAPPLPLSAPLAGLPGIGPTRVKALERLDLHTVGDLLTHYPRRYEDRRHFENFPTGGDDKPVCVCGIVVSTRPSVWAASARCSRPCSRRWTATRCPRC